MSIPNIPLEILERIVDFLHGDHAALCSTSLVTWKWVSASRYHLFNPTIIKEFRLPSRRVFKGDAYSFLSIVKAPNCTILPAIQNVVLDVTTLELMKNVVETLKHSKTRTILFLDHVRHSDPRLPLSWMSQVLPDIYGFSYNPWNRFNEDAWRLITSFPRLQSLSIYTQFWTRVTFPAHIERLHFTHLRTLRLKLVNTEQCLDWLQSLDGWHPALETLDIQIFHSSHFGWGTVGTLNLFLAANSGTLKHLSIGIAYVGVVVDHSKVKETRIDLSALSSLSSLFFRTHDINAICDSLASLNPFSKLELLTVHALEWDRRDASYHIGCSCDTLQLLGKLTSTMKGSQSFGNTALHLFVPTRLSSSDLEYVAELFDAWKQRNVLKLTGAFSVV